MDGPIVILSVLAKDLGRRTRFAIPRSFASTLRMTVSALLIHPRFGMDGVVGWALPTMPFEVGDAHPTNTGGVAPRRLGAQRAVREQRFRFDNRENILLPISFSSLRRCARRGRMFLKPLMLAGLGAAVIPLALHLLSKARYRSVDWGAMMFLEQSRRRTAQSTRLKQATLLLLRTAIIVALALALAHPSFMPPTAPLAKRRAFTRSSFSIARRAWAFLKTRTRVWPTPSRRSSTSSRAFIEATRFR